MGRLTAKSPHLAPWWRHARVAARTQRLPHGYSRAPITDEQRATASRLALKIFTDMVNEGFTFEAALTTIYLSGFENAFSAQRALEESE